LIGAALVARDQLLPTAGRATQVAGMSVASGRGGLADGTAASGRGGGGDDGDGQSGVTIDMGQSPARAPVTDPTVGDVAIAPPPAAFEAGALAAAASAEPAPAALSRFDGVQPEGGTWAVMIGIDDYPGTGHDLRSAVADAGDVNQALMHLGVPGDHRLFLRNGQASADNVRASVEWLDAHAAPDAVAVFFYAGHVRSMGGGTEAIVGADGGTVTDQELASLLDRLQAHRAWIALAACYSGGFTEVLRPGRVLTAAAPAGGIAYENEQFGRSYLVEYMVRRAMIDGLSGSTTIEGAFDWARREIARDYPDRVPVQYDDDPADLDLRPDAAAAGGTTSPSSSSSSDDQTASSGGSTDPGSSSAPGGSGGSPGSGSGDGGGGGSSSPPPPSDDHDGCARMTAGVVRCGSG
jgi:hypothetical protein